MSAPLVSWKRQPPGAPDEAAAARLLEAVGDAPTLSREAVARIRGRVQKGGKGSRGARSRSKEVGPLFLEPRISLLAAGIALLVILGALVVLLLGEQPRAKAPPVEPVPPVELKPSTEP